MSLVSDIFENDTKLNGVSATIVEKSFPPLNPKYRSKSLSTDKLNTNNADRAAILEDIEAQYVTDKLETPSCLVKNKIMESHSTLNG